MSDRLSDEQVDAIAALNDGGGRVVALAREVQERRAVEAELREWHYSVGRTIPTADGGVRTICGYCMAYYPCPTIRLLDGER